MACRPCVAASSHVAPLSRLSRSPTAAAAITTWGSTGWALTSCTSLSTSTVGTQLAPPFVERGIPPTWTEASNAPSPTVAVTDRIYGDRLPTACQSSRPATASKPVTGAAVPSTTAHSRASAVPRYAPNAVGRTVVIGLSTDTEAVPHVPSDARLTGVRRSSTAHAVPYARDASDVILPSNSQEGAVSSPIAATPLTVPTSTSTERAYGRTAATLAWYALAASAVSRAEHSWGREFGPNCGIEGTD